MNKTTPQKKSVLAIKTEQQKKQTIEAAIEVLRHELKRVRFQSAELDAKEKSLLLQNQPIFLPFRQSSNSLDNDLPLS